jgi:xanthine/uracil permease
MKLRYGLDDRPPTAETALHALQWLAMSLPFVVIVGTVAAGHDGAVDGAATLYLQKAAFVTGLMLLSQAFLGHRLTLVAGPATALLLGILGSRSTPDAVYTAIGACGLLLAALSAAGLFGFLRGLFTPRVTATVLLLIAFTMAPSIAGLLLAGNGGTAAARLAFASGFVASLLVAHRFLPARARSLLIVAGMAAGSVVHLALFGTGAGMPPQPWFATFFSGFPTPVLDPGAIVSFLFCFLALSLNEIGSMQAVSPLLAPDGMEGRIRRGMTVAGLVNAVAGFLGVIGPVDYSLSPGVIAASGSGSRFPLVPAAGLLILASLSPALLGAAGAIPPAVVGGILVYTLAGQVAAGMNVAFGSGRFEFEDGLAIGLPVLAGTVTALLPPEAISGIPPVVRSVAGNGFVIGVVSVLLLDRLFARKD